MSSPTSAPTFVTLDANEAVASVAYRLNEVIATPDDVIPEVKPEIMVEKQKARELLADREELF